MSEPVHVLGVAGSLRRGSYNAAALRACRDLAPHGLSIDIYEGLGALPHYNDDLRAAGFPPAVEDLRRRIRAADALLIATPEYNHSVPGVLKNALDWASRPPEAPVMRKPTAFLGASTGMLGSVRAQAHLRDIFVFFDAPVVNKPEVFIGAAASKFAADGTLTDEPTRAILGALLQALRDRALGARSRVLAQA
jgi:chromate reductase